MGWGSPPRGKPGWIAVLFSGSFDGKRNAAAARGRLVVPSALTQCVPPRGGSDGGWRRGVLADRTSYVCESFAIDRFRGSASQTAGKPHRNRRVAAAHAWRATVGPSFAARARLRSAARVWPPQGREKHRATTVHDELKDRCRIAELFGSPFRYLGSRAEITRSRCRTSRSPRRDRGSEAVP